MSTCNFSAGADYTAHVGASAGAVIFQSGDSVGQVRSINIAITDDNFVEGSTNELFFASGSESAPFAQFVDDTTVTVVIMDNDCKSCKSLPIELPLMYFTVTVT